MKERTINYWLGVMCMLCVFMIGMIFPVKVHAAIATGTSGTCSWVIDDSGVLTISPTDGTSGQLKSYTSGNGPWYSYRTQIKKVVVEPGVKTGAGCYRLFYNLTACTEMDLANLNTSEATYMNGMFYNCSKLTGLDLSRFDTSNVTTMIDMFRNCSALTPLDVSGFDTSNVTTMSDMFRSCSALTTLDVSGFDTSNVTDMNSMFCACNEVSGLNVSGFDTSNVTDMYQMFYNCSSLTSLDVSSFDTSNVTNMGSMFYGCSKLTSLDVSKFNTSKVTDMQNMFYNCSGLTSLDVSGFDTSNVTNMYGMFQACSSLTSLDLSGFDTSNVTNMGSMFYNCSGLTSLDVSGFDTSKVTNMSYMFYNCSKLTSLDLSRFDTSNVTTMYNMFYNCAKLSSINLGENFSFKGKNITATSYKALLPTPPSTTTTGKWIKYDDQDGNNPLTAAQLRDTYDPDTMSGIWVWQPRTDKTIIKFDANSGFTTQPDIIVSAADQTITMPDSATTQHPNQTYQLLSWDKDETTSFDPGTDYTYKDIEPSLGKFVILKAKWGVPPLNNPEGEYDVYLHGNESINIHDIPAGTAYQIWEETPDGWVLVQQSNSSGSIEPIQAQEASFENNYQPGVATVQFAGTKTLDGKAADANAYQFSLYEGNTLIETVSNITGGFIQFSPIEYEDSDVGTHTYKIKEVDPQDNTIDYDTHTETITVEVTDDGAGNLSAVATYDADGIKFANKSRPGVLKLTKTAEGLTEENKDATFTFKITLTNPNGQPISDDETIYWYYEDDSRITRAGRYAKYTAGKAWNDFKGFVGGLLPGDTDPPEADTPEDAVISIDESY